MSDTFEKTLVPGQARFHAKQRGLAKSSPWGVYDRARGSFPSMLVGIGHVDQSHGTGDQGRRSAEGEADRLNQRAVR